MSDLFRYVKAAEAMATLLEDYVYVEGHPIDPDAAAQAWNQYCIAHDAIFAGTAFNDVFVLSNPDVDSRVEATWVNLKDEG